MNSEKIWSPCNSCTRRTIHEVIWQHPLQRDTQEGDEVFTLSRAVRCCGCQENTFRKDIWIARDTFEIESVPPDETTFSPPRLWRSSPSWLKDVEQINPDMANLLYEVYAACNDHQIRLLSMGVRAVLDSLMIAALGGDSGTFDEKLKQMVESGNLTKKHRDSIAVVIDAGSASTHRGFRPSKDLIEEMVVVMENMVREHYITGPMLDTAKLNIPPKPPRKTKPSP